MSRDTFTVKMNAIIPRTQPHSDPYKTVINAAVDIHDVAMMSEILISPYSILRSKQYWKICMAENIKVSVHKARENISIICTNVGSNTSRFIDCTIG